MEKQAGQFNQSDILGHSGLSRQGFHKARRSKAVLCVLEERITAIVHKARREAPRIGARSMFYSYAVDFMGVNRFEQEISRLGLGVSIRKRKKIQTTDGVYEAQDINLIHGLELYRPRQVIASDITYFVSRGRLYYIFTLKDAYSGLILGLTGSDNMRAENAVRTLRMGLKFGHSSDFRGTIHHSDAGSQYKSKSYKSLLKDNEMLMSIAENCLENGMAEQLNGLIKNDYLAFRNINNTRHLNKELRLLQGFLNNKRTVKGLGNLTPAAFEQLTLSLPPEQRMKKLLYDFRQSKVKPP